MKRIFCAILCAVICLGLISPVFAETAADKVIREAGLSVTWLDPGVKGTIAALEGAAGDPLFPVMVNLGRENAIYKYGYMDKSGRMVVPATLDFAGSFNEGLAYVSQGNDRFFIDAAGNKVFDVNEYNGFFRVQYGKVLVEKNFGEISRYGLLDLTGKVILPCQYEIVSPYENGMILAVANGKNTVFDSSGNALFDVTYDRIHITKNCILTTTGEKWGLLSLSGEEILPPSFDYISYDDFQEGLTPVRKGEKWGFIDESGNTIIPCQYDSVWNGFQEERAAVMKEGKWGFVDRSGNTVIPFLFDGANSFENGLARVCVVENRLPENAPRDVTTPDGQYFHSLIDQTGNIIIGPKQYRLRPFGTGGFVGSHTDYEGTSITPPHDYSHRAALLDQIGNRLTDFSYTHILDPVGGYAVFFKEYYGLMGLMNEKGCETAPAIFQQILSVGEGTFLVLVDQNLPADGRYSEKQNLQLGFLALPDGMKEKPAPMRPITVYADGKELYFDVPAVIENSRTLVPMRKIFEYYNATVEWNNDTRTVIASKDGHTLELPVDSDTALVNGKPVALDTPAVIREGRTLVPLRFVAEALQCEVSWNNENRRVYIESNE